MDSPQPREPEINAPTVILLAFFLPLTLMLLWAFMHGAMFYGETTAKLASLQEQIRDLEKRTKQAEARLDEKIERTESRLEKSIHLTSRAR